MLKEDILKEELGISNDVSDLTLKVKNIISNNFSKNQHNSIYKTLLRLSNGNFVSAYNNIISLPYENETLTVYYNILLDNNKENIEIYKNDYDTEYNDIENKIKIFLTLKNNKINWELYTSDLQHEISHFYQKHRKNGVLLKDKDLKEYNTFLLLLKSKDVNDKLIGYTYYYSFNTERDDYVNALYRKIMELNDLSYIINPIDVLDNFPPYETLKKMKNVIDSLNDDEERKIRILKRLELVNLDFNDFIKTFDMMYRDYIRGYARAIYKAKNDLKLKYKHTFK